MEVVVPARRAVEGAAADQPDAGPVAHCSRAGRDCPDAGPSHVGGSGTCGGGVASPASQCSGRSAGHRHMPRTWNEAKQQSASLETELYQYDPDSRVVSGRAGVARGRSGGAHCGRGWLAGAAERRGGRARPAAREALAGPRESDATAGGRARHQRVVRGIMTARGAVVRRAGA